MVISRGLMRADTNTVDGLMFFWSISDWERSRLSPVSARRRLARRRRILGVEVSGTRENMRTKTGPAIQRISQSDQRQPFAMTAKPDKRGPRAGPQYAALTQTVRA